MSGTSMATPHVAGVAALLFEAKPTATAAEVEKALLASCRLGSIDPERGNRGALNAVVALQELTGIGLGATKGTRKAAKAKAAKGSKKSAKKAAKKKAPAKKKAATKKKPAAKKKSQ